MDINGKKLKLNSGIHLRWHEQRQQIQRLPAPLQPGRICACQQQTAWWTDTTNLVY